MLQLENIKKHLRILCQNSNVTPSTFLMLLSSFPFSKSLQFARSCSVVVSSIIMLGDATICNAELSVGEEL